MRHQSHWPCGSGQQRLDSLRDAYLTITQVRPSGPLEPSVRQSAGAQETEQFRRVVIQIPYMESGSFLIRIWNDPVSDSKMIRCLARTGINCQLFNSNGSHPFADSVR
jgi:hypothetical protein